jgi:PQQ enzyme repeat
MRLKPRPVPSCRATTLVPRLFTAPPVANGVVYVGSLNYNVYALNANTGALEALGRRVILKATQSPFQSSN